MQPHRVLCKSNYGIYYNIVIQLKPDDVSAYDIRGIAYSKTGEQDLAIKDFTKAIQLEPNYAPAYDNRGAVLGIKSEHALAIQDFTQAIQLKPRALSYYNRGQAWLFLQEWEKATTDLIAAKDMGEEIGILFFNKHTSVEDFEQKTGIQLPADIAALLTPPLA